MNVYRHPKEKGRREDYEKPKLSLSGHSSQKCGKHVKWSVLLFKLRNIYEEASAHRWLFPLGKMLLKFVCTSLWQW